MRIRAFTPPEEEGTGISMEYIYVIVAVIAIVVIAMAGYVYMKRGLFFIFLKV